MCDVFVAPRFEICLWFGSFLVFCRTNALFQYSTFRKNTPIKWAPSPWFPLHEVKFCLFGFCTLTKLNVLYVQKPTSWYRIPTTNVMSAQQVTDPRRHLTRHYYHYRWERTKYSGCTYTRALYIRSNRITERLLFSPHTLPGYNTRAIHSPCRNGRINVRITALKSGSGCESALFGLKHTALISVHPLN